MATIQLGNTKIANKLISYCEKRAEDRDGVNCPPQYAKSQFKATRELWGKTDGIQAHHVIQSFKPGEITPSEANAIGKELAKEIAKGHEAVVYTHADKAHIHNHIVINSVSFKDGKKYQSTKKNLYNIREASDRLCQERELSVVREKTADVRYTLAEKSLVEKGQFSWKDEIREKVNHVKETAKSYEELKQDLLENHGIEIKERGKHTTYIHHETGLKVRGNKLGEAYEKETIKHELERKAKRGQERGIRNLSNESGGTEKLGFNEHVFRTIGADRGENERHGNGTIQRDQEIHTDRDGTGKGTERTERERPTKQQLARETSRSNEEPTNRSEQESTRADPHRKDRTRNNEQGERSTSRTNESTPSRAARTGDELQAGTKAKSEGTLNGDRLANNSNSGANVSDMGNANPTLNGSELLKGVLKAVEESAKEIEAQQQAEQALQQRKRISKRQHQQSQERER